MKKPIEIPLSNKNRRFIRYNIMRMVNQNFDGPKEFEKDINKQLENLKVELKHFTKTWDVSQEEPYKLVKI